MYIQIRVQFLKISTKLNRLERFIKDFTWKIPLIFFFIFYSKTMKQKVNVSQGIEKTLNFIQQKDIKRATHTHMYIYVLYKFI